MYILYSLSILAVLLYGHAEGKVLSLHDWFVDHEATPYKVDVSASELVILYSPPMMFSRLNIYHLPELKTFKVTYNFKPCPYERRVKYGETFTGTYCHLEESISHVLITGLMKYIKSVYVTHGTLSTEKQFTNQSSDYREGSKVFSSDLAVDGIKLPTFSDGSCTSTSPAGPEPARWSLYYKIPQHLIYVHLTNRDTNQKRLAGFILETYSVTGELLETYREPGTVASVYEVSLNQKKVPVSHLSVIATDTNENILTICEIKGYVEYCPANKWGEGCASDCKCDNQKLFCTIEAGICLPGCPIGFYGMQCKDKCRSNCGTEGCTLREGHCLNCVDGYTGELCDTVCPAGMYGPKCSKPCSDVCNNKECDPHTGGCLTCREGMFGPECLSTCPENCADGKCEASSGKCLSCVPGLFRDLCDRPCIRNCTDYGCNQDTGYCGAECPRGRYGEKCSELCPDNCDACDDLKCFRCSGGFYGSNCTIMCPKTCQDMTCDRKRAELGKENKYYHWLIIGILGLFIVVVVAFFVIGLKVFL